MGKFGPEWSGWDSRLSSEGNAINWNRKICFRWIGISAALFTSNLVLAGLLIFS